MEGLTIEIQSGEEWHTVIIDQSFSIAEGEVLAMVGESGSGKSLLAMGCVDLLRPGSRVTEGSTSLLGERLEDLDEEEIARLIGLGLGVMFQDARGAWNPLELIGFQSTEGLEEHTELTTEEIQQRVFDALGEVKLPKRRAFTAFVDELSRGQAQRAMLAATLLTNPRMLIADEPLSGLDVTVARAVLDLIEDMRAKRGMAVLFVTHDLGVVAAVADRVAVVYGGMIVELADAATLFHTPRHPYTSGLLRSIPGWVQGRLEPIEGDTPELPNLPRGCPFAPRCPYVVDRCRQDRPVLERVGATDVACWRADEIELVGIS